MAKKKSGGGGNNPVELALAFLNKYKAPESWQSDGGQGAAPLTTR
jgi:hypothetical protein